MEVTIVFWRDIPAQVIAGRGRGAAKVELAPRFAEAIDRAAMAAGVTGTDAYLADWRREARASDRAPGEAAAAAAAELDAAYPPERLRALVAAGGRTS